MIKADSKTTAWELAVRLFPSDFQADEERSRNAGHPIFYSTKQGENAWISDLGDRLELNYANGSSENIWINDGTEKPGVTAIVGAYCEETVFGNVSVRTVKESVHHGVQGIAEKKGYIHHDVDLTMANGDIISYNYDNLAYIRFDSEK